MISELLIPFLESQKHFYIISYGKGHQWIKYEHFSEYDQYAGVSCCDRTAHITLLYVGPCNLCHYDTFLVMYLVVKYFG